MFRPLTVLPLHLACQLLVPQNASFVNVSLDTPLPRLTTAIPGGYTMLPDIGVAYKHYKNSLLWNDARKYCIADGGNLAVVDSYKKIEYVMGIKKGGTHAHVGIHRLFDETEWTKVKDGSPAFAIPWRVLSYKTEMDRQCMALVADGAGLFASRCNESYSFVCEVSIFKD